VELQRLNGLGLALTAKPRICLNDISKGFFGECLHAQGSNSPVRFFDGERLFFLSAMTACALGNDELFDFLVAKSSLRQSL